MPSESFWRRYRRFWGADPARDVDEELAFHIQMRVDELRRTGMSESEAQEATMKRFGDLTDVREECEMLSQERVRIKRGREPGARVHGAGSPNASRGASA